MNDFLHFPGEFSRRLRQERTRLALSQAEMATAGGVAKATQVGYEQATRKPDAGYLAGLLKAGADLMYLFTGISKREHALEDLDWHLLNEILLAVEAWCVENKREIAPHKRPELLRVLYRHFCTHQHVIPTELHRILRLAV